LDQADQPEPLDPPIGSDSGFKYEFFFVKWKSEIEMKLLEKMELELK